MRICCSPVFLVVAQWVRSVFNLREAGLTSKNREILEETKKKKNKKRKIIWGKKGDTQNGIFSRNVFQCSKFFTFFSL